MQTQKNHSNEIEIWQAVENSHHTFDLPRIRDIESIQVVVNGTVTLTGAGAAVRAEAPCQLIPRMIFTAGGKAVLDDVIFVMHAMGSHKRRFRSMLTPPSAFGVAAHAVRATAFIDRNNINGWRPKDSSFQAFLTELLQLQVFTGAGTDLFTGAPVGSFAGTVKVIVHSFDENQKADGSSDRGEAKQVIRRTTQVLTYAAANSAQLFDLPVGNQHRYIKVHCNDNVDARGVGEPSNGLVNSMEYSIDDSDIPFNMDWNDAREKNAADLDVNIADIPTGFAVIDLSPRGKFSDYGDVSQASRSRLKLDLAAPVGNGRIEIEIEEVIA